MSVCVGVCGGCVHVGCSECVVGECECVCVMCGWVCECCCECMDDRYVSIFVCFVSVGGCVLGVCRVNVWVGCVNVSVGECMG